MGRVKCQVWLWPLQFRLSSVGFVHKARFRISSQHIYIDGRGGTCQPAAML